MTRWASDYIGLPFRKDFQCGDLVRKVLAERFGIDLKVPQEATTLPDYVALATADGEWERVTNPRAGDAVVMMTPVAGWLAPLHVGIMVSATHLLHVDIGKPSVCVPIKHPDVSHRIDGYYRHRNMMDL